MECRYGKGANFELTKACLVRHDDMVGAQHDTPSAPTNFAGQFSRIQSPGKFKTKLGTRLPSAVSPQYSRRPDFSWNLVRNADGTAAAPDVAPDTAKPVSEAATHAAPPRFSAAGAIPAGFAPEDDATVSRSPKMPVALMSGLLAISVAVIAGMAVSGGNGFQFKGLHMMQAALPGPDASHAGAAQAGGASGISSTLTIPDLPTAKPADPHVSMNTLPNERSERETLQQSAPVPEAPAPGNPDRSAASGSGGSEAALPPVSSIPPVQPALPEESPRNADSGLKPAPALPAAKAAGAPKKSQGHVRKKHRKPPSEARPQREPSNNPFSDNKPAYTAQLPINTTRHRLSQCERISNLFRHERCKWEVCKHKWGREGCPSYQQSPSTAFGTLQIIRRY